MGQSKQEIKAAAAAEKASRKAMRPWFKKKRFIIPGVFVGIAVIAAAGGGGGDTSDSGSTNVAAEGDEAAVTTAAPEDKGEAKLFPGRADAQKEDQERNIGQSAMLSGYTATVSAASFRQSLSQFETDGYVQVAVTIANRDNSAQSYNYFDWKIQTPAGQVLDPTFTSQDDALKSGDLIGGGSVSGKIYFEVGATKGTYYIVYKPDPFDAARGIWSVTV